MTRPGSHGFGIRAHRHFPIDARQGAELVARRVTRWQTLAAQIAEKYGFGWVYGVPRGGIAVAGELAPFPVLRKAPFLLGHWINRDTRAGEI
jgi:hypothetical protein